MRTVPCRCHVPDLAKSPSIYVSCKTQIGHRHCILAMDRTLPAASETRLANAGTIDAKNQSVVAQREPQPQDLEMYFASSRSFVLGARLVIM